MAPNEPYLKQFICDYCHVGILQIHPEEQFAVQEYFKCPICGNTKQIKSPKNKFSSIIYGTPRKD
jgi:predicted RNA-binding Zn-ribbon protein involved in translation (DUF1610 family)